MKRTLPPKPAGKRLIAQQIKRSDLLHALALERRANEALERRANEALLVKIADLEQKYWQICECLKELKQSQQGLSYKFADFESRWPQLKTSK